MPGSHWVAIKNANGYSLCFDSFGIHPTDDVLKFADRDNFEVIWNSYRIQDFDSKLCGYFVIDFINSVNDYETFLKWLLKYSPNNFRKNDKIVLHRLGLK